MNLISKGEKKIKCSYNMFAKENTFNAPPAASNATLVECLCFFVTVDSTLLR
jgi:hypothetical protein